MRKLILAMIFIILIPNIVYAEKHELEELHIHTYIHADGSATITETRNATLSKGSENFLVIENIGESKITDFYVYEYGLPYEFVDDWDSSASQKDKLLKNGIIETSKGYELVWGIGVYGEHEYVLEYKVTDFIKQLNDAQMIYWYFVSDNTNIPPVDVTIEIESDQPFSYGDEKIWGFGFDGETEFKNGKILARNKKPFSKSDYAVMLVKFDEHLFATSDVLDKSFADIKEEATKEKKDTNVFFMLIMSFAIVLVIRMVVNGFFSSVAKGANYVKRKKKAPVKHKGEHIYEPPYKNDFKNMYQLLVDAKISSLENIIAAYLLKWIKEKRITIQEETVDGVFKRTKTVIQILHNNRIKDRNERELFTRLVEVVDETWKLDVKDLQKSIAKKQDIMKTWEKDIKFTSKKTLIEEGFYKDLVKRRIIGFKDTYEKTDKGERLEQDVFRFMNYLRDFSIINERESSEIQLWDEYMIWAVLLGIADEVQEQFSFVYPGYEMHSFYHAHTIVSAIDISNSVAYSAGAGGSFSGGGGGGAFGGGGGGTR